MNIKRRIEIEKIIRDRLVDLLILDGYSIAVDNGGDELELEPTTDADAVKEVLGATDEEFLEVRKTGHNHSVHLVYGNSGYDVICNYSMALDPLVTKLDEMIAGFEAEACDED